MSYPFEVFILIISYTWYSVIASNWKKKMLKAIIFGFIDYIQNILRNTRNLPTRPKNRTCPKRKVRNMSEVRRWETRSLHNRPLEAATTKLAARCARISKNGTKTWVKSVGTHRIYKTHTINKILATACIKTKKYLPIFKWQQD